MYAFNKLHLVPNALPCVYVLNNRVATYFIDLKFKDYGGINKGDFF